MLYVRLLAALPFRIVGMLLTALLKATGGFAKTFGQGVTDAGMEIAFVMQTHEKEQRRIVRQNVSRERLKETAVRDIERIR